jgi:hypothetical protein
VTSADPLISGDAATSDPSEAPLVNIRDTVKWMIASASAVAAVLVAGLQVKDLGDLAGSSPVRIAIAAGSASVALLLVLFVIAAAVRVLATPRLSVRDLSAREVKIAGASALEVRVKPVKDKLVQGVLERRTYLLGQHESIREFYDDYSATMNAQRQLLQGQVAHLGDRQFNAGIPDDVAAVATLVRQAQYDAERLESAAQLIFAEMRFQALAGRLRLGGVVFVAAVLTFAWVTNTSQTGANVTKPVPVQIYVRDAAKAGLPRGCRASELQGVAVGGTFTQPDVVTEPVPGCPSTVINRAAGVVVVPIINDNRPERERNHRSP